MAKKRTILRQFCYLSIALMHLLWISTTQAAVPGNDPSLANARISTHAKTGLLRFMGQSPGNGVHLKNPAGLATAEEFGLAFASEYGAAFGIDDPASQLQLRSSFTRTDGGSNLRYQQLHQGVPVFAGELLIHLDKSNAMQSMNGEISPALELSVLPTLSADEAAEIARLSVAKWYDTPISGLRNNAAVLSVYDARLLKPSVLKPSLVWWLEVNSEVTAPLRELVLVDAHSGAISLHFNQVHQAKNRATHDAGGADTLPGILVCSEADVFPDCALGDTDVINAHRHAGDAYDFYAATHGRDGIDGVGSLITSTVRWDDGVNCPNAFWDGVQMVYCDTLADADDVVAHEMTHGVTDRESNLLYYYQSGAINESFSDVWGEFVDLGNGTGDDSGPVRWLLGEDLGGAIRDMQTPGTFGDPDRMTSASYWTSSADGGGVHANSGINNKAAYLLTDGDNFNSVNVIGLGISKTAKIYYETQSNLLTSGADYADLYDVLYQACLNLVGSAGIIADDCNQVRNATDAVEMNLDPAGNPDFSPEASMCPLGSEPGTILFFDDMESNSNWQTTTLDGAPNDWGFTEGYASSGTISLYGEDIGETSDAVAWSVPVNLAADSYLHFRHGFGFETSGQQNFDGGVIEFSIDDSTWQDLGSLFDAGQDYAGSIVNNSSNPLAGEQAFVSESHGYVSSRYNLSSLAGEDFQVRFRLGSDASVAGPLGWVIDDVMLYRCEADPGPGCSGVDVLIQNTEFSSDTTCVGDSSITANTAVIVKAGTTVVFQSPNTTLGGGFLVESGADFSVVTSP